MDREGRGGRELGVKPKENARGVVKATALKSPTN